MPRTRTVSPRCHIRRQAQDEEGATMYSSPSPVLSSDDDDEEVFRATGARARPAYRSGKTDQIIEPRATFEHDDFMVPHRSLLNTRTSQLRPETSASSKYSSPLKQKRSRELYVTTMDEDDQQMFIALFYWRRKVIEAHFSAWKWVVFTLRRSAKQIHRHSLHTYPSKPNSAGYSTMSLRPPRRNLILKRQTGQSSESEHNLKHRRAGADNNTSDRSIESKQKCIDGKPCSSRKDSPEDCDIVAKRRQFRSQLHLVYSCFDRWRSSVGTSRQRRVHQLVKATDLHRLHQLKNVLQAWQCGTSIHRLKRKRVNDADQYYMKRAKNAVFCEWKRHCRIECEISRRQNHFAARKQRAAFQLWHQCILITRTCRRFAAKQCHKQLHRMFRGFQEGVLHLKKDRMKCITAISHYQGRLQLTVFIVWHKAVFKSHSYLQSIGHCEQLNLSTGVRRWKRFFVRRQLYARKVLLADFFRYKVSLRRAIRGWNQFLQWNRQRKHVYDEARMHYERNLKLFSIQKLSSAVRVNLMRRKQVRSATQWHQRKRLSFNFKAWVAYTRYCARLNQFRCAVVARKLNEIMQVWQDKVATIKSLRSTQNIVSKRWSALLLRTYLCKWEKMQRISSLESSIRLKRRNFRLAYHFRAWYVWNRNKFVRRTMVQDQLRRHQNALLQRVVSQWFGVTLRKRCFKRLVKLFRKKQSRNRLNLVFQLWSVHVHVCKANRRLNKELTRLALAEWKRVSCEHRNLTLRLTVATQYYCERRYALTIGHWSSFAHQRVRARMENSKALSHYFCRVLVSALHHWYIIARELRRQREFLYCRQKVQQEQAARRSLQSWYMAAKQRTQYRKRKWKALKFYNESILRRLIYAWIEFIEVCRASNERIYLAVTRYETCLTATVFRSWNQIARRGAQLQLSSVIVQNTIQKRRLQASVTCWTRVCHERRRRYQQISTADRFYKEYLVCLAMYQWQDMWLKASALRQKELQTKKKMNLRRLSKAVSLWHENFQHSSKFRVMKTKARRYHSRSVVNIYFQLWRRYHNTIRNKISKRKLVTRLQQQKLVVRLFMRWRCYSKTCTVQRLQYKTAVKHRTKLILHQVFQSWKKYRSKRTLYILAYFHRRRFILHKCWLAWKRYSQYAAKVHQNIFVTSQLIRTNIFRAAFVQWRMYFTSRKKYQAKVQRAEDHHVLWVSKRGVERLKKQVVFKQAVVKAAILGRMNATYFVWRRWKHFVAVRGKRKKFILCATKTQHLNRQRRHFVAWKSFTTRCVQARKNKSDALYRVSMLRMVWARWHRVIDWRRSISSMENRRDTYLQMNILRMWRANVVEIIDLRTKTQIAIAFHQANVQMKTWRSWQRYVTVCREKQNQLEWVFSFYSVNILLRRSLGAWKRLVVIQQMKSENIEVADCFNSHRLVRTSYRKWQSYTERRRLKHEQIATQLHDRDTIALSRTVQKWRSISVAWKHQHTQQMQASRFYNKRCLKYGVAKLMSWQKSQKSVRDHRVRATDVRNTKLLVGSFRRWQRYHQWRAKYSNLARVFKHNQKGDVFTRWKIYWQKRLLFNERQLKARVFRCIHVEQDVFTAWSRFLHTKKQKKMAKAFNTLKVLSTSFHFWKRKAHVLRQMKKMFHYQETFRAQIHFDAWKRLMMARKQLNVKLRGAMKFKDNLCKLDVWQRWCTWVSMQRLERETVNLAVGFRRRFFTRKTFALWKRKVQYSKRKHASTVQAQCHYQNMLLLRSLRSLIKWRQAHMHLFSLQEALTTRLIERRKRRAIAKLKTLCAESGRKRDLIRCAYRHWQQCHQQKYWGRIMQWFDVASYRKQQRIQADAFACTHLLKRCIVALQAFIYHNKQVKSKVNDFRCRYFRSVADDCFYRWRSFTSFKQKLRSLRCKTLQSQRRQRLLQWHHTTAERQRQRAGMRQFAVKRRRRDLITWFTHWESVCTDLWIEAELVAHHQRHAQKQRRLRSAVKALYSQLPVRHERRKCKSFFLQHHRDFLSRVLQLWRQACVDQQNHFNL